MDANAIFDCQKEAQMNRDKLMVRRLDLLNDNFRKAAGQIKQLLQAQTREFNQSAYGNVFTCAGNGEIQVLRKDTGHVLAIAFDALRHSIHFSCVEPILYGQTLQACADESGREWFTFGNKPVKPQNFEAIVGEAMGVLVGKAATRWS